MGKCKRRSVVHEPQYETCKVEPLRGPEEITEKKEIEEESKERSGEKRKGTEEENEVERVKGREVKYIGETSRSVYERMRDFRHGGSWFWKTTWNDRISSWKCDCW